MMWGGSSQQDRRCGLAAWQPSRRVSGGPVGEDEPASQRAASKTRAYVVASVVGGRVVVLAAGDMVGGEEAETGDSGGDGDGKQKIESISSRGVGCIAIEMPSVEQRSRLGMLVGEKDVDVLAVAGTGRADGVAGAGAVVGSEKQKDGYKMELKCVKCDVLTATLEHVMQSEEDVQANGLREEAAVQRKSKYPVVEYSRKNGSGKLLSSERPFCGTAWQVFHFMMCSCPL